MNLTISRKAAARIHKIVSVTGGGLSTSSSKPPQRPLIPSDKTVGDGTNTR